MAACIQLSLVLALEKRTKMSKSVFGAARNKEVYYYYRRSIRYEVKIAENKKPRTILHKLRLRLVTCLVG